MSKKSKITQFSIITISLIFFLLNLTVFKLQIVKGDEYKLISDKNYVRLKKISPIRGEIYDRKYRPIAENQPSFNLYIMPSKVENKHLLTQFLADNFEVSYQEVDDLIYKQRFRKFQELLVIQNVSFERMVEISEQTDDYPSLFFKTETIRRYKYPNHFSGYVGRINENEYERLKDSDYSINSIIGKTGLEKYYESILVGKSGYEVLQVDASGRNLKFFRQNLRKEAQDGNDLILTIDNDLQNYAASLLPADKNACILICDVKTGGVLAYVSNPVYNPNLFTSGISSKKWQELINDPRKPMLDRIINATYPPGSAFKPIIATLGLEDSLITVDTKLAECKGGMYIGDRFFKCWYEDGHGKLSLLDAIKYSCDVYFYDLSLKIELARMYEFTDSNYLLVRTGIDLIGERKGFFPTEKWYKDNYGRYAGIIGPKTNLAIGQGEVLTTPLQLCAYYTALARDGNWIQPHLLEKKISGETTESFKALTKNLPVTNDHLQLIQKALYKAVNESYGTGVAARVGNVNIFGKTGSAENHMGEETHSWFAGYASWNEPEISFVVFLENAGHGGSVSAPIMRKLIVYYNKIR